MLTLDYLNSLDPEARLKEIIKETKKCKQDPIYCIETYFSITDAETGNRIPAKLYPYQIKAIQDFENYNYNLSMKSRQMGFTTVSALYCAWFMGTKQNMVVNALANKLKTSVKFLKTVRDILDNARKVAPWLIPHYVDNDNAKISFTLKNGCSIKAESNNEDACRGETINLLIIDEVAAIDRSNPERMSEIWSSAGITLTRSKGKCIGISTPKGSSGWYFEQYTNADANGWNIIEAHWSQHPIYSQGLYQYIKDDNHPEGGYIKHFNETWPTPFDKVTAETYKTKETYNYIRDGRLRSPWYDVESKKLGVQRTRCELDCSFAGSGSEVLDPEVIRTIAAFAKEFPSLPSEKTNIPSSGIWKSYKQFKPFNPAHGYLISADVSTGDGSDFSAFIVLDITTHEVVATYKDQVEPLAYAKILDHIGKKFGNCLLIVENQGPGLTTLLELKNLGYPNIFYHTLKKADVTKTQRRKLGFWQGEQSRLLGGDRLEEDLNTNKLKVYSQDIVTELHTWIWDKDGKRRHAPGKNDDLLMALSNAMFYVYYVATRKANTQNMIRQHLEVISNKFVDDLIDYKELINDTDETKHPFTNNGQTSPEQYNRLRLWNLNKKN
jgi:hypothetical protein